MRIELDIESDGLSVRGLISTADAPARPFEGRIELLAVLDAVLATLPQGPVDD